MSRRPVLSWLAWQLPSALIAGLTAMAVAAGWDTRPRWQAASALFAGACGLVVMALLRRVFRMSEQVRVAALAALLERDQGRASMTTGSNGQRRR